MAELGQLGVVVELGAVCEGYINLWNTFDPCQNNTDRIARRFLALEMALKMSADCTVYWLCQQDAVSIELGADRQGIAAVALCNATNFDISVVALAGPDVPTI